MGERSGEGTQASSRCRGAGEAVIRLRRQAGSLPTLSGRTGWKRWVPLPRAALRATRSETMEEVRRAEGMEEGATENTEGHGTRGLAPVPFRAFRGPFPDFLHSLLGRKEKRRVARCFPAFLRSSEPFCGGVVTQPDKRGSMIVAAAPIAPQMSRCREEKCQTLREARFCGWTFTPQHSTRTRKPINAASGNWNVRQFHRMNGQCSMPTSKTH